MKIAVICNLQHYYVGGVENNNRLRYESWTLNHDVTEYPTLQGKSNLTKVSEPNPKVKIDLSLLGWKPHNFIWAGTYTKKNFKKIYDNHDVVIISSLLPPKKWIKHPKSILVQHMNKNWYTLGGKPFVWSIGQLVDTLFFGAGTITNSFKKANNAMFYAPETEAYTKGKKFYAALPYKLKSDIKETTLKRGGFVWIARLEQAQKNVKTAIKLANSNNDLIIYGDGPSKKMLHKKLTNSKQYGGKLVRTQIDKKLASAKGMIMTSNFEGFGFTVSEALTNGTPVILFNTFDACKFFAKSGAVFLIPKGDIKAFNEKMKWLRELPNDEYHILSEKAREFAKNNLSKEVFWNSWENALNTVYSQNK